MTDIVTFKPGVGNFDYPTKINGLVDYLAAILGANDTLSNVRATLGLGAASIVTVADLIADSNDPYLILRDADGAVDAKRARIRHDPNQLTFDLVNDANSALTAWLEVVRSAMTVSSITFRNGQMLKPNQSAFLARPTAQAVDVTGDGIAYDVAFGTEIFDQSGDFATPSFTAPKTGRYLFDCGILLEGLLSGHTSLLLVLTTSNRSYEFMRYSPGVVKDSAGAVTVSGSVVADLDAGDTAKVTLTVSNSTKVVDVNTGSHFSGILLA